MDRQHHGCDVLVIGGGPAGLAAACTAAESRGRVTLVDENNAPGGQVWRGDHSSSRTREAELWFRRVRSSNLQFIHGARVFHQPEAGLLLAESVGAILELSYRRLILATGARERFLPFPGWTLPNVMGAGGLQALVKSGMPISRRRVVVAGTGPLLLAVAAYLRKRRAEVLLVAEQSLRRRVFDFGLALLRQPGKASQAVRLKWELQGIPYLTDCWPVTAQEHGESLSVTLRRGNRTWPVRCDYLACGFYLVPNPELASLLGCELEDGSVRVNSFQETSLQGIYCAGEAAGVGGVDLSLVEGQIAGYAATDQADKAEKFFRVRERLRRFAASLDRAFVLREELKALPEPETIVCRCEDVTYGRLQGYGSWRMAKLQTRCGMGPCQGRICGPAVEFLLGWKAESVRPPIFPVRLDSLTQMQGPSSRAEAISR